jgi:steroid 5-alpha reductase family enzyme
MTLLISTFSVTLVAFLTLWFFSLRLKDASIVDMYWGPGFAVIAWVAYALAPERGMINLILVALLTLWGLRLGWHIASRHNGEDPRYAAMRAERGESFARWSLWMVFGLQAVIQWIASSPVLVAVLSDPDPMEPLLHLGFLVFAAGFLLEVWADGALRRFRADPANKGKLLMTGLHARIRHPQYLGEITLQWGLGLIAFGITLNPLAFVGPALMTVLIIKVSGVPMLEKMFEKREGFAEWKAKSGAIWPKW